MWVSVNLAAVAMAFASGFIGAMEAIGAAISTIMFLVAILVLAALALVLSAADWAAFIALLWQLLGLLGWS